MTAFDGTREVGVHLGRAIVAGLGVLLAATGVGMGYATGANPPADASSTSQTGQTGPTTSAAADRPSIVVVLVDDMSANLLPYMTRMTALAESSVQFESYVVSNPLCCPSRATLQTGKYPHNSQVRSNWWPGGGFGQFVANDLETSLGPYLDDAGYRTGLMGKYMNEYVPGGDSDGTGSPDYPPAYVPPGWDEWFVAGNGYGQFAYDIVDGRDRKSEIVQFEGDDEANYLTDVLAGQAEDFISRASTADEPFFLMVAPFAVHGAPKGSDPQAPEGYKFRAAPRDRSDSPHRPPDWGEPSSRPVTVPTFLEIAETPVPDDIDGKSLLGLVEGKDLPGWRQGALVEYLEADGDEAREGPDRVTGDSPATYNALRTQDYLYVDHSVLDADRPKPRGGELYDLRSDPDMIVNLWGDLDRSTRNELNDELGKIATCEGDQCKRRQRDVPSLG